MIEPLAPGDLRRKAPFFSDSRRDGAEAVLTKNDEPIQFVTLEDETGLVEVAVFPDAFRRRGQGFTVDEVVPARGVGELQDGVVDSPVGFNSQRPNGTIPLKNGDGGPYDLPLLNPGRKLVAAQSSD